MSYEHPHHRDLHSFPTRRSSDLVPARAQDAAAPFDGDLQRLAEILGTLHYLRGICGSNEGAKWRNQMQALIDAETDRKSTRLNSSHGYISYAVFCLKKKNNPKLQ